MPVFPQSALPPGQIAPAGGFPVPPFDIGLTLLLNDAIIPRAPEPNSCGGTTLPVDERHPLHPTDVNGINKMAGEWYHIVYNNVYDLRATSLRLTNTYGPRMRVCDGRQTFLGLWLRLALEGKELQIYGDYRKISALGWRPRVPLREGCAGRWPTMKDMVSTTGTKPKKPT